MTFKRATDRLIASGITLVEVARAFDVTPSTVSRWRSGRGRNQLTPPENWPETLADLARRYATRWEARSHDLRHLAAELLTAQ